MKKITLLMGLIISIQLLYSHPPKKVDVSFDKDTQILSIVSEHNTPNGEKHFIDEIMIERNGQEILIHKILFQSDQKKQNAQYLLSDVREGDELKITVHCNVYGKKTEILKL